jgi:hypothetical protein
VDIVELINNYITSLPEPKRSEIYILHNKILQELPSCKLWFLDGKDENGKIVTNPNIGYGQQKIKYTDGRTKDFYQIGISANKSGISTFIIGFEDKTYLSKTYEKKIGKAIVSSYCIKFKSLKDINIDILLAAIQDRIKQPNQ